MLIGLQGSLQVEHGPSLVEGTDVPKVASDRGVSVAISVPWDVDRDRGQQVRRLLAMPLGPTPVD